MSAIPTDEPAQDAPPSIDTQHLQQLHQEVQQQQPEPTRKRKSTKAPSVRRACIACHTGKTRCSEVLPCQSCLKRGLGATCTYPDPDAQDQQAHHNSSGSFDARNPHPYLSSLSVVTAATNVQFAPPPPMYATLQGTPNLSHQQYYDYNGTFTGASTSTFRPNKRPRNLTDEEAAAITRNFTRGDFYVGSSAPVRIDPRLPVRLTLGEGDHVHFTIGESLGSLA
ncbi:hypothetical protein M413DRAFT_22286 [Hebeloma cylindrosporum]|uniref:Zn(2)-C6 fungal-type domain-containing protein n=1 Tax=Hebeloma cylindrosporum TaxID=76867 RepID=A0A0C3CU81_HEBCY|nr:hypothetical protein M413DRAFT_22286 [Hebeloma cylindrosporum h7]